MAAIRRIVLHMEGNERYAVMDTDEGFFLYQWSFEDVPIKTLGLRDYMATAVKDFARYQKSELTKAFTSISVRDLNVFNEP